MMAEPKVTERELDIQRFLKEQGLSNARRTPLLSDASFRRYERLYDGQKSFMLMDAPPPKEDIRPFVKIDHYLRQQGFHAPHIYAADEKYGFILLEDFGNDSFTSLLSPEQSTIEEFTLYQAAVDVLIQLGHQPNLPDIAGYNDALMLKECQLLVDWYLPNVEGVNLRDSDKQDYMDIWSNLLDSKKAAQDVLVLRDYHADNLMWLPNKEGISRVGLLDFQDAVIGSPVYDLVSLLEDARRDVSHGTVLAILDYYLDTRRSVDKEAFALQYAMIAAQRNCKIIGIFARLAVRDLKPRYLHYLPRVWRHLDHDLRHPHMEPLRNWLDKIMTKEQRDIQHFKAANIINHKV